ncbi:MAG: hypothetical protein N3G20_03745 [Verrucomicrobiae bacterium]|nr:hypothetical protein [Verrucomicrobiae bacterium]
MEASIEPQWSDDDAGRVIEWLKKWMRKQARMSFVGRFDGAGGRVTDRCDYVDGNIFGVFNCAGYLDWVQTLCSFSSSDFGYPAVVFGECADFARVFIGISCYSGRCF